MAKDGGLGAFGHGTGFAALPGHLPKFQFEVARKTWHGARLCAVPGHRNIYAFLP
jgi:hypothetical protein